MRIKISVNNSTIYQNINIQNIMFKYRKEETLPTIYFKCHKRFENVFSQKTLIFHNYRGQEIFRSNNVKLDYKYYEDDRSKEKKIRFVVRNIEFENYGKVSSHYMLKILKNACNAKITKVQHIKKSKYGIGIMRYIEQIKAMKYKPPIYKKQRTRHTVNQIIEKIHNIAKQSTTPT